MIKKLCFRSLTQGYMGKIQEEQVPWRWNLFRRYVTKATEEKLIGERESVHTHRSCRTSPLRYMRCPSSSSSTEGALELCRSRSRRAQRTSPGPPERTACTEHHISGEEADPQYRNDTSTMQDGGGGGGGRAPTSTKDKKQDALGRLAVYINAPTHPINLTYTEGIANTHSYTFSTEDIGRTCSVQHFGIKYKSSYDIKYFR